MNSKIIKSGDSTFVLETVKPIEWGLSGTITLDVVGLDGTLLIEDNVVSTYAGDTVSELASAGEFTIELTNANVLASGDKIAIGSDAIGHQYRVVKSFDAENSEIKLEECLKEDVTAGSDVIGLAMSSTVDISATAFDDVKEVTVKWKTDQHGLSMTETWRILSSYNQYDGLAFDFTEAYPSLVDSVNDVQALHDRAYQWMKTQFYPRDFQKIVDNQLTKETTMLKMAQLVGVAGDMSEELYNRIKLELEESLVTLNNLPIWSDTNDDDIKDDDEVGSADMFTTISRGI